MEEEPNMFSRKANTDKVLAAGCPVIVRMHILSLEYKWELSILMERFLY